VTEVYLDACCFIYLAEGSSPWRAAVQGRLATLPSTSALITSRISRLECRAKPIRDHDSALLARYDAQFAQTRLVAVSESIIERATDLRARYGFRSPDAIHLATAIDAGVGVFLRGRLRSRSSWPVRPSASRENTASRDRASGRARELRSPLEVEDLRRDLVRRVLLDEVLGTGQ
jgi:predicted nucleic acid-binding protein